MLYFYGFRNGRKVLCVFGGYGLWYAIRLAPVLHDIIGSGRRRRVSYSFFAVRLIALFDGVFFHVGVHEVVNIVRFFVRVAPQGTSHLSMVLLLCILGAPVSRLLLD